MLGREPRREQRGDHADREHRRRDHRDRRAPEAVHDVAVPQAAGAARRQSTLPSCVDARCFASPFDRLQRGDARLPDDHRLPRRRVVVERFAHAPLDRRRAARAAPRMRGEPVVGAQRVEHDLERLRPVLESDAA
jgi:hypothetical protein